MHPRHRRAPAGALDRRAAHRLAHARLLAALAAAVALLLPRWIHTPPGVNVDK